MSQSESKFIFVGGQLVLDFINTHLQAAAGPVDLLSSFSDLITWLHQAGVLDSRQAKTAQAAWGQGEEAGQLLDQARKFRGVLHHMIDRLAHGQPIQQSTVDGINQVLARNIGYNHLVQGPTGFEFRFQSTGHATSHLLVPIAQAAGELLCQGDPARIRECGNPPCSLRYYDTSKNRTRRWCSMAICGNRMKAAAFYQRTKKKD